MRPLAPTELLAVWEQGLGQPYTDRAISLLAAASPENTRDDLARLSVGERDGRLLTLREWTFGSHLVCISACPKCREPLESFFDVDQIRLPSASGSSKHCCEIDGHAVVFRIPDSLDLRAIEHLGDPLAARQRLIERCITPGDLPEVILEQAIREMERADAQANLKLALQCPACEHSWNSAFDIVSFFWKELHAWACRLLREVHQLARAYGWREADILALSPTRRSAYLQLL